VYLSEKSFTWSATEREFLDHSAKRRNNLKTFQVTTFSNYTLLWWKRWNSRSLRMFDFRSEVLRNPDRRRFHSCISWRGRWFLPHTTQRTATTRSTDSRSGIPCQESTTVE